MRISRHDWDAQQVVYDEYPEVLFQPLLEYLLNTQAWIDDPRRVVDKVNALRKRLLEHRSPPDSHREAPDPLTPEQVAEAERKERIRATSRANLAKARAAHKRKLEAARAETP